MTRNILASSLAVVLIGCSVLPSVDEVLPDRKVDYKKTKQAGADLEIPPDLTKTSIDDTMLVPDISPSGSATYSDYAGERSVVGVSKANREVLPQIDNVSVMRDQDQRWLLVQAPADDVWFKVVSFWQEFGILLVEQDPTIGVMRTDWIENRADIKTDAITGIIRKAFDGLYSAGTRDQYRIRLEQGDKEGTTEVFLTHRGMEERFLKGTTNEDEQSVWMPTGSDPEMEAEMLRRMMLYFGVTEKRVDRDLAKKKAGKPRSQLITGRGGSSLNIAERFSRAWRLTGMALDRGGFAVEDRDRTKGVYYVRYDDPMKDQEEPGMLSKLAFWKDEDKIDKENQYQVKLYEKAMQTQVVVLNSKGSPDNSETATRILTLLHEQIK
ncbi:outer membrane protein assembly factor BamC [Pseudomonadota bacterium]